MIVTCEECSTSFQLDDSRIPASGARVRCSRCKHAFFLPSPSASQSQAIESVVAEAVQGRAGRTPPPTRDLGRAGTSDRSAAAHAEPEEEDWQFSEEIRVEGDDDPGEGERGHAGSPDPSSFDLTGDFGRGFDPDVLASPEPVASPSASASGLAGKAKKTRGEGARAVPTPIASDSPGKPPEPVRDESSFGTIDDFSSLIDDDDSGLELATDSNAPGASASALRAEASPDDLGDPESWDLVGGDEKRHARSTVAALVRPTKPSAKQETRGDSLDLFGDSDAPPIHDVRAELPAAPRAWAKIGRFVGWCVTVASVAGVGGALLQSEWARRVEVPQRLEIGPLVAETTRSGWLESSRAGLLLVFEGELRNAGSKPLAPIPIHLALLDRAGERLGGPPLLAGRKLEESVLREARPEDLERERAASIAEWSVQPLAPGEVRPFVAIVPAAELPSEARRVLLESGPAAQP